MLKQEKSMRWKVGFLKTKKIDKLSVRFEQGEKRRLK